jgi:hypothetical protein
MDRILEHVINKIRVGFDEIVQSCKDLQVFSFLLMEQVEPHLILIELHLHNGRLEFVFLFFNHLFSFLDLFLLFLQLLNLLINLFLHHLEQVLMLNLQLVHDSSETLFKFVNFFVELLSDFHFELVVELLRYNNRLILFLNFRNHLLDHSFHFVDFRRNLNYFVLHFCVLQDTLGTEHSTVVFAVELNFLTWMNITKLYVRILTRSLSFVFICLSSWSSHGKSSQHRVVDWKILWRGVVADLVVWTLDHLVFVKLFHTFETE